MTFVNRLYQTGKYNYYGTVKFSGNEKTDLKHQLMDQPLPRKHAIVETIIHQLKNIFQIEHSHHRSSINFLVYLLWGLIA